MRDVAHWSPYRQMELVAHKDSSEEGGVLVYCRGTAGAGGTEGVPMLCVAASRKQLGALASGQCRRSGGIDTTASLTGDGLVVVNAVFSLGQPFGDVGQSGASPTGAGVLLFQAWMSKEDQHTIATVLQVVQWNCPCSPQCTHKPLWQALRAPGGAAMGWVRQLPCWKSNLWAPDFAIDKCSKYYAALATMHARSVRLGFVPKTREGSFRPWLCVWHACSAFLDKVDGMGLVHMSSPMWLAFKFVLAARTAADRDAKAAAMYKVSLPLLPTACCQLLLRWQWARRQVAHCLPARGTGSGQYA